MIRIYEICKVTQNVLLELSPIGRLENVHDSSLISNISCPKQSNFLLHFLRTENCLSRSFGTVECLSL